MLADHGGAMAYRYLTCPETAHLEMIECDDHPLGLLIQACTRFRPACKVGCPRTCAALMDRRDRDQVETIVLENPGDTAVERPLTVRASSGRSSRG
jgi:hypothetical protein